MIKPRQFALLAALSVILVGCSAEEEDKYRTLTPNQIYQLGEAELRDNNPEDAAEIFEEVERRHPYSGWSKRGTIMAAYSYGQADEFAKSRSAATRFLASYPGDKDAPYAQYLIAMSYYDQLDRRGRDQANTTKALDSLQLVMENYPESDYAKSAELKFELAKNHLAAKEMEIGRYYLKRGNYTAAINRFQFVVEEYGTTAQTPEALHRLVEAYLSLGLVNEARQAAVVLGYNFQGSEWYQSTHRLFTARGMAVPEPQSDDDGLLDQFYRRTIKGDWL